VRQHRAGVQDEGSQLMPLALAAVPLPGPDRRWLDLCAGPGGKAAMLDGLAGLRDDETHLTAVEKQPHRADLVRGAVTAGTTVVVGDGTDERWGDGSWDRVLLDAPCSGLGALRRRPEARWRKRPGDLAGLGRLQRDLLTNALAAARPGGVVAYVTCSPHLAETQAVVSDALHRRDDVEVLDARAWLPDLPDLGDGPTVQLWPHRHGTDAMFLALLRRRP
jgi:16S rRNA (cytosine967-C5)-methyltransferase